MHILFSSLVVGGLLVLSSNVMIRSKLSLAVAF